MTITLERPDLRSLTPAELAELAAIGAEHNGELAEQVAAEKSRRERVRRMAARRVKMISGEGIYNAEAQYAQARAELNGQLVAHHSKWPDDFALWFGNEATARANATTDLCEWWDRNPRIAAGAFDEQLAAHDRAAREAYEHDRMDRDDSPAVRPGSASGAGIDVPRAGSAGNRRHGGTARGGHVTITDESRPKSATGQAVRARMAARQGTGAFGGQAEVAVREPSAVIAPERQAISGDVVLRAIRVCLGYMAVWPSEEALIAATAFVAQSHARQADDKGWLLPVWQYSPRFFLTSEEGGSGKSWMARMMSALCPSGKRLVEPTKASLIQIISEMATVVITEFDLLLGNTGGRSKGIVAVANAGYEPENYHTRMKGGKAQEIPLFGPVILDGLDSLIKSTGTELRTMFSRCIIVHAKRAPTGYRPPRFDAAARQQFKDVQSLTAQWMAQEVANGIGEYVPEAPEGFGNRPAAIWEPLVSVCDRAGGEWPAQIRNACVRLESAAGIPPQEAEEQARTSSTLAAWAEAQGIDWDAGNVGGEEDDWA